MSQPGKGLAHMTLAHLWDLIKKSCTAWLDDYAPSMGAALAYYTLFSLAPFLIVVIAVAGLVFGAEAARGEIVAQLRGLIGEDGAVAVQGLLTSASHPATSILAGTIGVLTLLLGATSVFGELQSALDRIWRSPALQQTSGLRDLLRGRLVSFGMIVSIGFLLLVSLVMSAALSALGTWSGEFLPGWEVLLQAVNLVVSFAITTVLFAMVYRILPRVHVAWEDVWVGASVTAFLFSLGKSAIGLYLGKAGVTSGFGAAGSLVVMLVWVYYSAQIFLLGAEFTWVFAHSHGSRAGVIQEPAPDIPSRSAAPDTPSRDARTVRSPRPQPLSAGGRLSQADPRLQEPLPKS
jgi:membrane protein